MAKLKKNAVNQILFTMVDKTDFATLETSLASNFTVKAFKTNHGSNAASVSALARLVSKVGSGFYRLSLEANACNCDFLGLRVAHASAATQMMIFEMATQNDADLSDVTSKILVQATAASSRALLVQSATSLIPGMSDILSKMYVQTTSMLSQTSDIQSNLASFIGNFGSYASDVASAVWAHADGASLVARVLTIKSTVSDAHSAAAQANSRIALAQSNISDTQSALDSQYTIISSRINKPVATASRLLLAESVISDAHSAAAKAYSQVVLLASAMSDLDSALTSRFSDIHSFMSTTGVGLNASTMSDLRSAVTAGAAGTVTLSDISDIVSAVWKYGLASQTGAGTAASRLTATASRALVIRSTVSDTYSLVSDITSALALTATSSDVASAVWAQKWNAHSIASSFGSLMELISSRISDIQSAVALTQSLASDAHSAAAQANSRALVIQSIASDAHSAAILGASHASDAYSVALINRSLISDVQSQLLIVQSMASDAHSAAAQANSRALVHTSTLSDMDSAMTSQYSDIISKLAIAQSASSDAASGATVLQSRTLVMQSWLSDLDSALTSRFSDIHSFMSTTGVGLNASTMSDLRSAVAAGPAATITDADISNITSAVWYRTGGSDATSKLGKLASRITKPVATASALSDARSSINSHVSGITATVDSTSLASAIWAHATAASLVSRVSDVQSALDSQYAKVYSLVGAGGLDASSISNIASAVWGQKWTNHSVASSFGSLVELMSSRISDTHSAATKGTSMALVNQSWLSDIHSLATLNRSLASDAHSAAAQANSRALVLQSWASDIDSAITSRFSDTLSLLRSVFASTLSDIDSAVSSQYTHVLSRVTTTGIGLNASALSDIGSVITAQLDTAFTDATSLNADGIKDRLRNVGWILRNKMKVSNTGAGFLYKDDDATEAFSVATQLTSDATSVVRKRWA